VDDEEAKRPKKEKKKAEIGEKAMDEIKEMVGLDNVKEHIQKIASRIETSKRQGADLKKERFGTVFIGSPGTGKAAPLKFVFSTPMLTANRQNLRGKELCQIPIRIGRRRPWVCRNIRCLSR
jgi:hypothetical protein